MRKIKIADRLIGEGEPCYVIAEMSCNHNGDYQEAVKILEAAKDAGADAVKVQTYTADTLTRDFKLKLKGSLWEKTDLYSLYQKASMPWDWQPKLKKIADQLKIHFISSPFDETSVDFLVNEVKVPALKVASFEAVDTKLLEKMAQTSLPIILSNGMMYFEELQEAVTILRKFGNKDLALLQCNSGYPAAFEDANLNTMPVMADEFDCVVGLSDHTLFADPVNFKNAMPHLAPLESVKMGAKIVEVHLMINREESRSLMAKNSGGFDWPFSREPNELKQTIELIRAYEKGSTVPYGTDTEKTLASKTHGTVCFQPTPREMSSRNGRPSLWIVKNVAKGEPLQFGAEANQKQNGNFDSIRPSGGLHIRFADLIQNKKATRNLQAGEPLTWDMLE